MTHDEALSLVQTQAIRFADHDPTLGTLLEEVAEFARSLEGKHADPPALELIQIGSIVINMLRSYAFDSAQIAIKKRYERQ